MSIGTAVLALVAVVGRAPAGPGEPTRWLGVFTPLPGARRLCEQHVLGQSEGKRVEIAFTLYATTREAGETARFYAVAHEIPLESGSQTITVRVGENKGLSVHPVSGEYPECGVKPGQGDRAVIVVSEKIP